MSLRSEEILQINLVNWFKHTYPAYAEDLHHFANERTCSVQEGRKLKRMGVSRGVADIFLAVPCGGFSGLWIELKTETGKASKEQLAFLERKASRGYISQLCFGLDSAKEALKDYLQNDNTNTHVINQIV